jgi:hypothetical protein
MVIFWGLHERAINCPPTRVFKSLLWITGQIVSSSRWARRLLRAARKITRDCNINARRRQRRFSCGAYGAKRHKGDLLYWATLHRRIAVWREIQNDFYAGWKDDSRTTRTVR